MTPLSVEHLSIFSLAQLLGKQVFSIIAVGFALAWIPWISEKKILWVLRRMVAGFLMPCLIAEKILTQIQITDLHATLMLIAGSVVMIFGAVGGAHLFTKLPVFPSAWKGQARMMLGFHNYGFVAYPIVYSLLGAKGLALCFMYAVTADALLWSLGVALVLPVSGSKKIPWAKAITPPFVVTVFCLCLAFSGGTKYVPHFVIHTLSILGKGAIPLALTCVGALFGYCARAGAFFPLPYKPLGLALFFRAALIPFVWTIILITFFNPSLSRSILLIQGIMPASIVASAIVSLYQKDSRFSVLFALFSLLSALIQLPIALDYLMPYLICPH